MTGRHRRFLEADVLALSGRSRPDHNDPDVLASHWAAAATKVLSAAEADTGPESQAGIDRETPAARLEQLQVTNAPGNHN